MEFIKMRDKLIRNFKEMTTEADSLFTVSTDKDELWNTYINSFPEGTNKMYRTNTEHDCSCCKSFIKRIGNVVVLKDNQIKTIWDFESGSTTYQPVLNALSEYVKAHAVTDVFVTKFKQFGALKNFEETESGKINTYSHFFLELPDKFVNNTNTSSDDIKGRYRDTKNVFKRSLDEITTESLNIVLELVKTNSLYKGVEWQGILMKFAEYKREYEQLTDETEKENFLWEKSVSAGIAVGRIRNHSMGTLLLNISEGMDLDTAVRKYEQIVAPVNYKRSKPVFTEKMLEDAKKKLVEMGYINSLERRFATLDDITANNILFSNKDAAKRINKEKDIFDIMKSAAVSKPKKFSRVDEITMDDFVRNILPTANELEVYFENKHSSNMVSLIAPKDKESKTMFKWDNNFGWAYSGNMTDSMKERVKAAGGRVDGVLRFSIQWNESGLDESDLDAHCIEPDGDEIFYNTYKKPRVSKLGGQLDVDIINPARNVAVENITWPDKKRMAAGTYKFFVHQFTERGSEGFKAEIEFDGQIYAFEYTKPLKNKENVQVAEVTLHEDGTFTIKNMLPANVTSKEIWGIKTNRFVPVSVVCYSPNYWDEQSGIGHKHILFMLKDCISDEQPNAFYNEFLNNELIEHRKVMEALGEKLKLESVNDQLSGVGFSTTKHDELIVKVIGNTERVLKIKF